MRVEQASHRRTIGIESTRSSSKSTCHGRRSAARRNIPPPCRHPGAALHSRRSPSGPARCRSYARLPRVASEKLPDLVAGGHVAAHSATALPTAPRSSRLLEISDHARLQHSRAVPPRFESKREGGTIQNFIAIEVGHCTDLLPALRKHDTEIGAVELPIMKRCSVHPHSSGTRLPLKSRLRS